LKFWSTFTKIIGKAQPALKSGWDATDRGSFKAEEIQHSSGLLAEDM
jgi:hypothetical protein